MVSKFFVVFVNVAGAIILQTLLRYKESKSKEAAHILSLLVELLHVSVDLFGVEEVVLAF